MRSPAAQDFADRHIGPRGDETSRMLAALGYDDLDALVDAAVPAAIRTDRPLDLPAARSEEEVLRALRAIATRNRVLRPMIGQGYSGTVTPAVIRRNVLESPAWYTAYTPYQPEISQGRLEALLNFQTVVSDLTGLDVANASLLDEATAVAEAVALMWRASKATTGTVVLDAELFGQSLAVALGRARAVGLPVVVADLTDGLPEVDGPLVGVVLQQVGASGVLRDLRPLVASAHERGALVTVAADLLALTLVTSPGELGADVAVGSAQRFGVPLFGGGPHAAFMAVRSGLARTLPGRLVGVSVDADGAPAYRLALQTREQHIRREKATSNICTAQALLAIVASMYAVYHGPDGLRAIARRVHGHARGVQRGLRDLGVTVVHDDVFDTVRAHVPGRATDVARAAVDAGINVWVADADHVQVACDETTTAADVAAVLGAFVAAGVTTAAADGAVAFGAFAGEPSEPRAELLRTTDYLTHPVFHVNRSETAMLRYLRRLSDKDLALDRTMIPLGSCTMKLNATAEMEPISWPEFADVHPYAPADQTQGYADLVAELQGWLAEITGYAAVSVQPNAGSQGELAGLLAIHAYHEARRADGDEHRDVCLIPASAHGTNAASAALAGLKVVVVATAEDGEVDLDDLRAKLDQHGPRVAAIMITYPSTHGVYEEHVRQVCDLVHVAGGQVYIDGANLNALVGLARPAELGGDVSHLNLHKTFCIPHGGGGPGVGPVAVAAHLAPYLPGDPTPGATGAVVAPVAAAPWGSAGILPISWAYVALMGPDGLRRATETAVLAANYLATRLREHFPVLYTGPGGLVAHECILDLRPLTKATGVTAEDVAKRLMDYGFHAPTLSFPVPGTLMVEPTESEDLTELDRFVEALVAIRAEIQAVADGRWPLADSPLRQAPHTAASVSADVWEHPYGREQAAFGVPSLRAGKYWPPVRRIDGARGDRQLVCSCPPVEAYADDVR
ncbi:aminomethyl-transferring glycine dehydrogenase [Cellulomonas wangsupingiae]|uniref:Glycine dehydrogenase (decarboxylating) n=1 Tax=Cellulomonas wangsupingiae TaxID=2968085 RepID=A0ABY5KAF7_9CELL|nr:aminomethyl-transferring glycine dehydrogenase [Cellulomonas wangsupingiae]MCC2334000.1 aminomethyl-transferring glycine dehydrogenase [Cellulomonas wangsupingiae]UUI66915.1 aminomethyl-transferring glycine dehydrogenase [Cellulomonas wangsupingiae]